MNLESFAVSIISGALGSLLASFVILGGQGFRSRKRTRRDQAAARWVEQKRQWASKRIGVRQGITNEYTFLVLKYLLLGNLLWVLPEILGPFTWIIEEANAVHLYLNTICLILGLIFFLLGLRQVFRYMRLRATDGLAATE